MRMTALKVIHYAAAIPLGVISCRQAIHELGERRVEPYPQELYESKRLSAFVLGINRIILLTFDIFLLLVTIFAVVFSPVVHMTFIVAYVVTLIASHYIKCDFEEEERAYKIEQANISLEAHYAP